MKVKIKKTQKHAVIPFQAREGDFCYDVIAVSEQEIAPNVWRYGLGFAYEIERDAIKAGEWLQGDLKHTVYISKEFYTNFKLSIDLRPRSSIWKTGMILSNCTGTLDEFYRGEVAAVFYHIMPNMPRYKIGDKIGQIKLGITLPMEFELVEEIDMETERGEGGFGSTDNDSERIVN